MWGKQRKQVLNKEIFTKKKNLGQFWIRDWELVKPCSEQLIKGFLPLVPAIPVNQGLSVKKEILETSSYLSLKAFPITFTFSENSNYWRESLIEVITLLGVVNKLFKSFLTTSSNVLPLHLKQTLSSIIGIFTEGEGDGIKSRLPFKIFSTLPSRFLDHQKSR